jgi:hypothetical protein
MPSSFCIHSQIRDPEVINAALVDMKWQLSRGHRVPNPCAYVIGNIQRYQMIEQQPLPDGVHEDLIPEGFRKNLRLRGYLIRVSMASMFLSLQY